MCPICVSTLAYIAAGVTSTAGITTLVVSRLGGKNNRSNESDIDKK